MILYNIIIYFKSFKDIKDLKDLENKKRMSGCRQDNKVLKKNDPLTEKYLGI